MYWTVENQLRSAFTIGIGTDTAVCYQRRVGTSLDADIFSVDFNYRLELDILPHGFECFARGLHHCGFESYS
jgi:hypothetical protein